MKNDTLNKVILIVFALIITALLILLTIPNASATEWTDDLSVGLTDYYTMDIMNATSTGTYNNITADYNRVLPTSASIIAGKIGSALNFSLTQGSAVTDVRDFNVSFTDNFWMKGNYPYAENLFWELNSDPQSGSRYIYVGIRSNLSIGIYDEDGGGYFAYSNITMVNNTFTMVTISSNSTWWFLYLNGTMTIAKPLPSSSDMTASYERMPRLETINKPFYSIIDEEGLWNRTLTSAEITQLYNGGSGIIYQKSLTVDLMLPVNEYNTTNQNVTFSVNITDSAPIGVKNVTLLLNNTINQTNATHYTGFYNFSVNIPYGFYNWSIEVYDNSTNKYTSSSRNFTVSSAIVNKINYNVSTYETKNETFDVNITTNGTAISSAWLYYNGSTYSATITNTAGDNYNLTKYIDIPTGYWNKTFAFNYTLSGTNYSTSVYQQNVSETAFALCNATYTDNFLNITFKDESDLSYINASIPSATFVYYLGSGLINKTYSYTNTSVNYTHVFCATPDKIFKIVPEIQYKQGTDYPQRIWEPSVQSYNSTVFEQTLYLLNTADGLYVTFQVINTAEQAISDVSANGTRSISGSTIIVGTGATGSDGGITFWVNPDFLHTFGFYKSGYGAYTTSIYPTQSSYTITLGSVSATNVSDYTRGINYTILPAISTVLINGTDYSFNFSLTSSYWTVEEFGFHLVNSTGSVMNTTSAATNGGILNVILNTGNSTNITMNYYWIINGNYTNMSVTWIVWNGTGLGYGLKTFFTHLSTYITTGLFGLTPWGLGLIVFFVIFISVGIMSYKFGLSSPSVISGAILGLVFLFDVVLGLIPNPVNAVNHFPTVLIAILTIAVMFWGARR